MRSASKNLPIGALAQNLEPNDRGHYPIELTGVELGVWFGSYQNQTQHSLRWWDSEEICCSPAVTACRLVREYVT